MSALHPISCKLITEAQEFLIHFNALNVFFFRFNSFLNHLDQFQGSVSDKRI